MGPRLMDRKTARRVVTRDGVVLNANLETGADSPGAEMEPKRMDDNPSSEDHVMSFMTYGGGVEMMTRKKTENDSSQGRNLMATVSEERMSLENDILPPYDAGDGSVSVDGDTKSPSGTMAGV